MTKTLKIPDFKNEAEEAAWWDSHPDQTLGIFERAVNDGTLGRGTLKRRAQTVATSIRLNPADTKLAKQLARRAGIKAGL